MRILFVEDEEALTHIIKKGLEEEGYSVDVCHDGEEGLYMAEEIPYDGIILDIMLPGIDGLSLLNTLRENGVTTPVLMLTARGALEDKIKGLDTGADDYLTKPFKFGELLARLRAILRRKIPEKRATLKVHDLEIDTGRREARRGGKIIPLTSKEYALLEYLAYNKDSVLSRTEITEHIYNDSFDLDSNIIDVFITTLRRKIDRDHPRKLIHTVRGAGYILKG
ncbi:MAG: response regulator [Thermodesulfobacteriota bacterium]